MFNNIECQPKLKWNTRFYLNINICAILTVTYSNNNICYYFFFFYTWFVIDEYKSYLQTAET